ncbi:hypothetical protein K7G90_000987 [Pasteurella canis]|uniref:Lipoprotein n=1 Tax=Pasteurella canis TaxID=753 RepID=A0A379EUZ8_9PAST|nr:hypothetical protein [Pasteurella canis]MXN89053.1 hypothetical protein [Pasteurella canis]UAY78667.1 hypothetical protein K7G90_000987 [Pasteurella canis]UDW82830.1 hypothetical protein K7G91_001116 [Pasteurella canis]UEA15944.1 hypothetical protein K7G92_001149 [Pasteurella canis]UEC22376.1 hypothetical protein K7G93_001079 [Pasteurella canis]
MNFKQILMAGVLALPPFLLWSCERSASPLTTLPNNQEEIQYLKQFNSIVKITPAERYITQDAQNNDLAAMTYHVQNLSDKPIKTILWNSVYILDSNFLYTHDLPIIFEAPLAPRSQQMIAETVLINNIPRKNRPLVLNTKNPIKVIIIAREIIFDDGTKVTVSR